MNNKKSRPVFYSQGVELVNEPADPIAVILRVATFVTGGREGDVSGGGGLDGLSDLEELK